MSKDTGSSSHRWLKFFLIGLLFVATLYYFYYNTLGSGPLPDFSLVLPRIQRIPIKKDPQEEYGQLKLILDHPNCKLINLPLTDPTLHLQLSMMEAERIRCHTPIAELREDNRIQLSKPMMSCCYKPIIRVNQTMDNYDIMADRVIKYGRCQFLSFDGSLISHESIKVPHFVLSCFNPLYSPQEWFSHPPPPEEYTTTTQAKAEFWKGVPKDQRPPSILIVGIDSVSRLQFNRNMPRTRRILKAQGYSELMGYNRIGLNTFPNLMGMLAEMPAWVVNGSYQTPCTPEMENSTTSGCPFIWKTFSSLNYVTALQEDGPSYAIFNYEKTGFVDIPTDYYSRPFFLDLKMADVLCPGGLNRTTFLRRYTQELLRKVGSKAPLFSLTWLSEQTHSSLVNLKFEDDAFAGFIQNLSKIVPNAFILFVGDHGYRYGEFRETFRGYFEESLPFFFLRIPQSYKTRFPEWPFNLKRNTRRLTSTFDVYATLEHILHEVSKHQAFQMGAIKRKAKYTSLFEEIPVNRSCNDAGIEREWCRCGDFPESYTKYTEGTRIWLDSLILRINSYLEAEIRVRKCAKLKLNKFLSGRKVSSNGTMGSSEYLLIFKASPSGGVFEGRIRAFGNGSFEIIGEIARINLYGEQSKCVETSFLKNYCFCLSNQYKPS